MFSIAYEKIGKKNITLIERINVEMAKVMYIFYVAKCSS